MASRIVFMGTPAFAVPSLKALIEAGHQLIAVYTQPDKPKGRGLETLPSPVKAEALSHGIKVLEPAKIRDEAVINEIRGHKPDFIVVVAYGKILPQAIIDIPPRGCVNLHASLLPKYRGAAPINWAIIRGERETGNTTMLMDAGMDTGPMLLTGKTPIGGDETAADLAKRLSTEGAMLLARTIGLIEEGKIIPVPQDNSQATYAPILKKEDGRIDWTKSAQEIKDLIRGVVPWPGAFTTWKGILKIHSARPLEIEYDGEPGTVAEASGNSIKVKCGSGALEVLELQPENKRRMSAGDFIKGYRIAKGERFV